jgi:hypothetical protein
MLHGSCTRPKPPNRVAARLGVELTERSGGGGTPFLRVPGDVTLLATCRFEGSDNVLLRYAAARR